MEINVNVSHYGKKIEELSKDERTLLMMDSLSVLGHSIMCNPSFSENETEMKMKIGSIVKQRCELSVKLLNLELDDFSSVSELMDYIETTRYGISKFGKDLKENEERIERHQRMSVLN
jgi:hypothetical protein